MAFLKYGKDAAVRIYSDGTTVAETFYGMYVFKGEGNVYAEYYAPHESMISSGKKVLIKATSYGFEVL